MWKGSHEPMGALGRSKIADWTSDRARTTRQDSLENQPGPFRLYPSPAQLRWATSCCQGAGCRQTSTRRCQTLGQRQIR